VRVKCVNITDRQHALGTLQKKLLEAKLGRKVTYAEAYEIAMKHSIDKLTGMRVML